MNTHVSTNSPIASRADLRGLVDEIVYARALLRLDPDELGEHDAPLRRALGRALGELADTEAERRAIAEEALERAWARLWAEFEPDNHDDTRGPLASAA